MKTKAIKICGKDVTLAYCYATEVGYLATANEDVNEFADEAVKALSDNRMPNVKKCILLILASVTSYYESKGEKSPLTDHDLMFDATPTELGTAAGTVLGLRAEFYHLPAVEQADVEHERVQRELRGEQPGNL